MSVPIDGVNGSHYCDRDHRDSDHEHREIDGKKALDAATRCDKINRLPLVVVRKRPTLTSFHPTPPGSSSLLQVSINSEDVHRSNQEAPAHPASIPATQRLFPFLPLARSNYPHVTPLPNNKPRP